MGQQDYLKELRIKCGYTQQQIADVLGVTKSTISKYEKGLRKVNSEHVEKLSKLYKTDPIYIMTGRTTLDWQQQMESEVAKHEVSERAYWESELLGVNSDSPIQVNSPKEQQDKDDFGDGVKKLSDTARAALQTRLSFILEDLPYEDLENLVKYAQFIQSQATPAPQSPPAPQEGTDTTPPPEGAEGPQEGGRGA